MISRDNDEQVLFAYKLYQRTDAEGIHLAAGFKEAFARHVDVAFVGVWFVNVHSSVEQQSSSSYSRDTVSSVGIGVWNFTVFRDP